MIQRGFTRSTQKDGKKEGGVLGRFFRQRRRNPNLDAEIAYPQRVRMLITQSNYIPWRGYFANLRAADEVVFLNSVQFTKRDWRNRNLIEVSGEPHWLTIPVDSSGSQNKLIKDMVIVDKNWVNSHLTKIERAYSKAPFFSDLSPLLSCIESFQNTESLINVIVPLTVEIMKCLNIQAEVREEIELTNVSDPSERLVRTAEFYKAQVYVSAPAAAAYLSLTTFKERAIEVEFTDYTNLPMPKGLTPSREKAYSIIHEIAHLGLEEVITLTTFSQPKALLNGNR